ncbi:GNAT family N-acetyltransferase [Crocinitomix catalasitica]|nr:GNAT family N-acetyltransferase [Crocinitomix catalasitica]
MIIQTLSNIGFDQISAVFNLAFADYSIPMIMTEEQLKKRAVSYRVDLDFSVGVFDQGNLVAFILNATETDGSIKRVYNAGTGVVPVHRGKRLTKRMYDFILPILKEQLFRKSVLEVIDDNIPAIKVYEGVGFNTKRKLRCYKGVINLSDENSAIKIEQAEPLWDEVKSIWDTEPTWQNTILSLEAAGKENDFIVVNDDAHMVAYASYDPKQARVHQFAVHPDYRRKGYASALFKYIAEKAGNEVSIINVDESDIGMAKFFGQIGMQNYLNQIEMELDI